MMERYRTILLSVLVCLMLVTLLTQTFYVIPNLLTVTHYVGKSRAEDLEHLEKVNESRKLQIKTEAEIILLQQQALKLAKKVNEELAKEE